MNPFEAGTPDYYRWRRMFDPDPRDDEQQRRDEFDADAWWNAVMEEAEER